MPEERRSSAGKKADETRRELRVSGNLGRQDEDILEKEGTGKMTVEEAGHLGGEIGGHKVKRLIEEGKEAERRGGSEPGSRR
jgi:hypothetical protein